MKVILADVLISSCSPSGSGGSGGGIWGGQDDWGCRSASGGVGIWGGQDSWGCLAPSGGNGSGSDGSS